MAKKARVLVAFTLEGNTYRPDMVVEFDDKLAKALEKEGRIDANAEAVAYCVGELKAEVVKHAMTDEEAARIAEAGEALAAEQAAAEPQA